MEISGLLLNGADTLAPGRHSLSAALQVLPPKRNRCRQCDASVSEEHNAQ